MIHQCLDATNNANDTILAYQIRLKLAHSPCRVAFDENLHTALFAVIKVQQFDKFDIKEVNLGL